MRRRWQAVSLFVLLLGGEPASHAGFTDPVLVLSTADAAAGATTTVLQLAGRFHADDLVQVAHPLQILIRESAPTGAYVRYALGEGVFGGVHPPLSDGLDPEDAVELLSLGSPVTDARVLSIQKGRIDLVLPGSFPSGPAEVQLFVVEGGLAILSNPLPVTLPAPRGP